MEAIKCKKCGSCDQVKAGFAHGQQRYQCRKCRSRYLPGRQKRSGEMRKQWAVELYTEGMSIRAIGRLLHTSHVTVLRWLKVMATKLKPAIPLYAKYIEIDELYFFLGSKKQKRWLWLAICRDTKRILGFQTGGRGKVTLRKLLYKISPVKCRCYCTDRHGPFKHLFAEGMHRSLPGQTNTIEGINSAVRHYLARFRRRSKCYTKSLAMVEVSIWLLMYKWEKLHA